MHEPLRPTGQTAGTAAGALRPQWLQHITLATAARVSDIAARTSIAGPSGAHQAAAEEEAFRLRRAAGPRPPHRTRHLSNCLFTRSIRSDRAQIGAVRASIGRSLPLNRRDAPLNRCEDVRPAALPAACREARRQAASSPSCRRRPRGASVADKCRRHGHKRRSKWSQMGAIMSQTAPRRCRLPFAVWTGVLHCRGEG